MKGADTPAMQEKREREAEVEAITLTTEAYPEGLKIAERIEVVTAECTFGMNVFKDMFAGVRDIVGGRSEAVQPAIFAERGSGACLMARHRGRRASRMRGRLVDGIDTRIACRLTPIGNARACRR
ncbi:heavy metal-binding domain-containing protein [Rhodosalinus sediminis]|uniref:heavy metal-binding domain-containing protein n=1 Tax=Rhodosalinus sediminis TaxID=1940533 RepID=UPI003B59F316